MKILGLTGSIATGKTFVAEIFKKNNIKLFISDLEVAKLLKEKTVVEKIKEIKDLSFSVTKNKEIDKKLLSDIVFNNLKALKILEKIVHPLIKNKIKSFIYSNKLEKVIVLDIPLLFENNYQSYCTKIITTFCSQNTQEKRALERNNINKDKLNFIIKQQIPGNLKAALTDYLVYTDISVAHTKKQIDQILLKELE